MNGADEGSIGRVICYLEVWDAEGAIGALPAPLTQADLWSYTFAVDTARAYRFARRGCIATATSRVAGVARTVIGLISVDAGGIDTIAVVPLEPAELENQQLHMKARTCILQYPGIDQSSKCAQS